MSNDFLTGFSISYINTLIFYPAYTIIHKQFYKNQSPINIFNKTINKKGYIGLYSGVSLFSIHLPLVRGGEIYFQRKFQNYKYEPSVNIALGTFCSNIWKFFIYPINTFQINKQVLNNYKRVNPKIYWNGYLYNLVGGSISSYTWFYTYHTLNDGFTNNDLKKSTISGSIASMLSDTVSHPFKVFKLLKQTNSKFKFNIKTAFRGYFFRLATNCLQGASYGFLWNQIDKILENI
tara:strand:- start:237 stop:938 length:702 start_codon:yes stop_codon:yes gene_type:complete